MFLFLGLSPGSCARYREETDEYLFLPFNLFRQFALGFSLLRKFSLIKNRGKSEVNYNVPRIKRASGSRRGWVDIVDIAGSGKRHDVYRPTPRSVTRHALMNLERKERGARDCAQVLSRSSAPRSFCEGT